MKASHYNIFFPFHENHILFNALQGTIFLVDSETKDLLEKNEVSSLNEELTHVFTEKGVIVNDHLNEQNAYNLVYERSKYVTSLTDVEVATTYQCNLACVYCYQGKGELETKKMDEKTVKCAIKFIKGLATSNNSTSVRTDLFGGEPLLNMPVNLILAEELSKWCEENNKNFFMSAITNGTVSTEKNVEDLAQYNCSFVVVLDGPQKIHDTRRVYKNQKGTFNDIVNGLHRVCDYGLKASIRINMDKTNKEYIIPFFTWLKEEGLTKVSISIIPVFNTSPACASYSYCMPDVEGLITTKNLYRTARSMGITTAEPQRPSPLGACDAQKLLHFVIDPYLRLFKCNIQLPFEKNVVGVIDPETAQPVLNHVNVEFMSRNPLTFSACKQCKLVPVCRGGCLAEVYETQGTPHSYVCREKAQHEILQENVITYVEKRRD
jgi:uncharacterized protein